MNRLGTYIQRLRSEAGYSTQKAFADVVGKDPSWVSRLERGVGKETPPPEDIALLATALGVTQQDLLLAAGYELDTPQQPDSPALRSLRPILESYEFTDNELRALAGHIRSAVDLIKGQY